MTRPWIIAPIVAILPALQESSVTLRWNVNLNSRFAMQFNYAGQRRTDILEKGVGTLGTTHRIISTANDKREVEAELSYREVPGRAWSLCVDLKKVSWTYSTDEYEIALTRARGKDPQTRVTVREKDKNRAAQAKADADQRAEHMKRLSVGEYDLVAMPSTGQVVVMRSGAIDTGFALFGRIFIQPPCPSDPVSAGQSWKDAVPQDLPGVLESGVIHLPLKVTAINEKTVTVKGTAAAPLSKPANIGDAVSGTFSLEREFVFSREGYVQSSREEFSCRKSLTNKTTFFGGTTTREENASASTKQTVALKPLK